MNNDTGHQPPAPTTEFRRPLLRFGLVLATGVFPVLFFLSLLANAPGWVKLAPGAAALAFIVLGIRSTMLGISAGPDHIVVRNFFRTHQVDWEEISGFEMPVYHETLRNAGLRIIFDDRRPISVTLYARGDQNYDRAARLAIEQLEQLRQQRIRDDSADQQLPIAHLEQE